MERNTQFMPAYVGTFSPWNGFTFKKRTMRTSIQVKVKLMYMLFNNYHVHSIDQLMAQRTAQQ